MLKTIEAKGDSIDEAVQKALTELGADRDDVSVEVLQKPKSGFLGFGREPAIVRVSYETSPADTAREFLSGLLERFGTPARIDIEVDQQERAIRIELSGENMGAVIGRRGDTLDAIQYLTSIVANREEEERWRITVDTESYRKKRESALQALAQKTAQKALKYRKPVALEPMNPHERRIIHSALQDFEGVTTHSTGSEPNRRVIVTPTGTQRAPQSGRSQGGRRSGRRPQGSRPQGGKPGESTQTEE